MMGAHDSPTEEIHVMRFDVPSTSRLRSARRKAILRMLKALENERARAAAREPVEPATSAKLLSECAGRPYLVGAGTFLVAHYLNQLARAGEPAVSGSTLQSQRNN
jgi:hypothetical protein